MKQKKQKYAELPKEKAKQYLKNQKKQRSSEDRIKKLKTNTKKSNKQETCEHKQNARTPTKIKKNKQAKRTHSDWEKKHYITETKTNQSAKTRKKTQKTMENIFKESTQKTKRKRTN